MWYFGDLFIFFFKLERKQLSIQSRDHCVIPSEAIFLPFLWSDTDTCYCSLRQRIPSLKLSFPIGCWSIANAGSEPWIRTSNNLRELDPDDMLGVASVQFPQVPGVYTGNWHIWKTFDSPKYFYKLIFF